ncbi:MAG: hypothetical protein MZU79_07010 [Anaerotruncus sp.]|nr:hypothetical protein [Anaerotruncus sp.]
MVIFSDWMGGCCGNVVGYNFQDGFDQMTDPDAVGPLTMDDNHGVPTIFNLGRQLLRDPGQRRLLGVLGLRDVLPQPDLRDLQQGPLSRRMRDRADPLVGLLYRRGQRPGHGPGVELVDVRDRPVLADL